MKKENQEKEILANLIPKELKKKKAFLIAFWSVIILAVLVLLFKLFTLSSLDVIIGAFIIALILLWRELNSLSKEIENIKSKLKEK